MSDDLDEWDRLEIDSDPVPDDEKYGDGLEHDYEAARETCASGTPSRQSDDNITEEQRTESTDCDAESWDIQSRLEIDSDPVPDDKKYGDGLEHDHEAAHETAASEDTQKWHDETEDDGVDLPPETPAWIDDTRGLIREDLKGTPDSYQRNTDSRARARYQIVTLPHDSAWLQLLERHDLLCAGGEHHRLDIEKKAGLSGSQKWHWVNSDGLELDVNGDVQERDNSYISYLTIRGPEQQVIAFTENLLELAQWIKRELCAPAPIEVAGHHGMVAVDDSDRLIDRDTAAAVVRRLARSDEL